jgi:hypothetical protein
MEYLDLKTYVDNYKLAAINPVKEKVKVFLTKRANQIKLVHSSKNPSKSQIQKALNEQNFINAVIDLETEYSVLIDNVANMITQALGQYEDGIKNGADLRDKNNFLSERLKIMDDRELDYIEILKSKK